MKTRCRWNPSAVLGLLLLAVPAVGLGEERSSRVWAAQFYSHFETIPNLTYKVVGRDELKLDLYRRSDVTKPVPTLLFIHGGGWERQSKSDVLGNILPWLEMGWTVVNVDYRLAGTAPAPAAVEDCLSALRWVGQHAKQYGFDLDRLVISGASAGGELALMIGMAPASAGLDPDASTPPLPQAAAIVNVSGITDIVDLIQRGRAVGWIPRGPNREELARRLSPLTYVRPGLPPILTIHGDADPSVPYEQAVRFHAALTKAGVANQLFTIPGGKHGGHPPQMTLRMYETLRAFLAEHHLTVTE